MGEFVIKVEDFHFLNYHVVYLKLSVRRPCTSDSWYKFSELSTKRKQQ
jgi:hypothetical protein